MTEASEARPSWFQRFLLPGFAFKAVVIGGGYATGRELAEFFLPSGPRGGLMGMVLAMVIWSVVCAVTFALAHKVRSYDYRTFFQKLLGPAWVLFEIAYAAFVVLVLAVIGAAAGAIGAATLGAPAIVGSLVLAASIALVTTFGNSSVERLFKYAAILLYGVYALFVVLGFATFGDRISASLATDTPTDGWMLGGLTYAGYNIVAAVVILPLTRHLTSQRDAVVAGVVAGPLAMIPALLFFTCMIAFYPAIGGETLPSDFMLREIGSPLFHLAFQAMIFVALLETGVGAVHAINERIDGVWQHRRGAGLTAGARAAIAVGLLIFCILVADRFGLIALIASGYRTLAYVLIAVYVVPLLTIGMVQLLRGPSPRPIAGEA